MNEQQRAELERIRGVLYPATGLEDYDEEIIGRVLKDIKALLAQDALDKMADNARELGLDYEPAVQEKCFLCGERVDSCASDVCPKAAQPVPVKTYHDGKPWPVAPKPWVGLTDEEVAEGLRKPFWEDAARALEAILKEKNHG